MHLFSAIYSCTAKFEINCGILEGLGGELYLATIGPLLDSNGYVA